ncbi:T9SS type A sorting domain-containing protein [Draconibacterium sediminis]|uniref:Secretion system C-terminal sorting domain-containing protein n=1 Tax=Draconibacterium sediminis TaxID=1544798 RepID=A0A0D8J5T9_9BACT|nr:T9SS type A sorting domain-containing protein [Draconibacterium sediminis]KJF41881.1 hypothetical protein LH29_23410 [Draconibacterium sediminis]
MEKNYTRCKRWYCYLLLLFCALLFSYTGNAQITIDGNPSTTPGEWVDVFTDGNIISSFVIDAKRLDGTDNQFTGGAKDYDLATGMYWEWGQVSDKDELTNAAVAVINDTMYFCTDRNSTSGSSQVGFWVFQDGTAPYEAGITPGFENEDKNAFFPAKAYGDMLILATFTEGGRVPDIEVYQFDPSQKGKKRLIEATVFAEAEVSSAMYTVPDYTDPVTGINWNEYEHKDTKTVGDYYPGSFFEGRVDLLGLPIGIDLCGAWFFFETRNSHSTDAMLNDFVGGTVGASPEIEPIPDIVCVGDPANLCVQGKDGRDISGSDFYWFTSMPSVDEDGIVDPTGATVDGPCMALPGLAVGTHSRWVAELDEYGCWSNVVQVDATVEPRPALNPASLTVCENVAGEGVGTFDLTEAASAIGLTGAMSIDYLITGDSAAFDAEDGDQVTVVAYFTANTLVCESSAVITLHVEPRPVLSPTSLTECENVAGEGVGTFDLTEAASAIGLTGEMAIDYLITGDSTAFDAEDGDQVTVVAYYTANDLVCESSAIITLHVEPRPVLSPASLTECENVAGEGVGTFDLTEAASAIGLTGEMAIDYLITGDSTAFDAEDGDQVTVVAYYTTNDLVCESSAIITLHVNPNPLVSPAEDEWCVDFQPALFDPNDYNAEILDDGQDINDFTFSWDKSTAPDMPTDIYNPVVTVYNVTVTDVSEPTNCQSSSILTITVYPGPAIQSLVVSQQVSWIGAHDGALDLEVAGGTAPYSYAWTGPDGFTYSGQDPTGLYPGIYEVTVTDARECTDYSLIELPPAGAANVILVPEPISCVYLVNGVAVFNCDGAIDATVSGAVSPYRTYIWTGPDGFTASTEDISNLCEPGFYQLVIEFYNDAAKTDLAVTLPQVAPFYYEAEVQGYPEEDALWIDVTGIPGCGSGSLEVTGNGYDKLRVYDSNDVLLETITTSTSPYSGFTTVFAEGGYYVVASRASFDGEPDFCEVSDDFTVEPCPCNTAFGYGGYLDGVTSRSFLDDCEPAGPWSNWGWTNYIAIQGTYNIPMYAGAPACEPEPEYHDNIVGTAVVDYSGGYVSITFTDLKEGYNFDGFHIWTGDTPFPPKDAPGQWTTGLNFEFDGGWIVIHAVYCGPPLSGPVQLQSAHIPAPTTFEASPLIAYPNPFSDKVTFEFVSGKDAHGVLEVYNLFGQRVARVMDRPVLRGELNKVEYAPEHRVSGIYLYRLDLDGDVQVGRIIYKE